MTAFDLFRTTSEGTEWVATFLDVEAAKIYAKSRASQVPGAYFIVDQLAGNKLFELGAANSKSRIRRPRGAAHDDRANGC
jgi:hypothetical protein